MSLRNSLAAAVGASAEGVARCAAKGTNHATGRERSATGDATDAQQESCSAHDIRVPDATDDATDAQQASCASREPEDDGGAYPSGGCALRGPGGATRNYGALTRHRLLDDLVSAIDSACDERGDDQANRRALIEEAARLTPEHQLDMLGHFAAQAILFRAARQGRASRSSDGPTGAFSDEAEASPHVRPENRSEGQISPCGCIPGNVAQSETGSPAASRLESPSGEAEGTAEVPAGDGEDRGRLNAGNSR